MLVPPRTSGETKVTGWAGGWWALDGLGHRQLCGGARPPSTEQDEANPQHLAHDSAWHPWATPGACLSSPQSGCLLPSVPLFLVNR